MHEQVDDWVASAKRSPSAGVIAKARGTVLKIWTEASDLLELWSEAGDRSEFVSVLDDLTERLS